MSSKKFKPKTIKVICNNCFQFVVAIRDETGLIKYQCPRCGAYTISKAVGRRHLQLDIYAPHGQEFVDDY